jgi:hypothetical protein
VDRPELDYCDSFATGRLVRRAMALVQLESGPCFGPSHNPRAQVKRIVSVPQPSRLRKEKPVPLAREPATLDMEEEF